MSSMPRSGYPIASLMGHVKVMAGGELPLFKNRKAGWQVCQPQQN